MKEIRSFLNLRGFRFERLGRKIFISPKTKIIVHSSSEINFKFEGDLVELTIKIGELHTASLIMSSDALEALRGNEEVLTEYINN